MLFFGYVFLIVVQRELLYSCVYIFKHVNVFSELDRFSGNIKHSLALIEQIEDEVFRKMEENEKTAATSSSIKCSTKCSGNKVNSQPLSKISEQKELRSTMTKFTGAVQSSCSLHSESEMSIHLKCTPSPNMSRSTSDRDADKHTSLSLPDRHSLLGERYLSNSADYKLLDLYKRHKNRLSVTQKLPNFTAMELGKYRNFQNRSFNHTGKLATEHLQTKDLLKRFENVIGLMAQEHQRLANQLPNYTQWRNSFKKYPYRLDKTWFAFTNCWMIFFF